MTRTPEKVNELRAAGATPVLCDLFDQKSLTTAVKDFRPDVIVNQVTNLPDEIGKLAEFLAATDRVRSEGTRNLLAAAQAVNASGFVAQSIAWGSGPVIEAHENAVISAGGTVLRYGQFYGPGTYYENDPPPPPRIHVDDAARRTVPFLAGTAWDLCHHRRRPRFMTGQAKSRGMAVAVAGLIRGLDCGHSQACRVHASERV